MKMNPSVNTSLRILARWRNSGHELTPPTASTVRQALFPERKRKVRAVIVPFQKEASEA